MAFSEFQQVNPRLRWVFVVPEGCVLHRTLWAELKNEGRTWYMCDFERRVNEDYGMYLLSRPHFERVVVGELRVLMDYWARRPENRTSRSARRLGWRRSSLTHQWDESPRGLARRIWEACRGMKAPQDGR